MELYRKQLSRIAILVMAVLIAVTAAACGGAESEEEHEPKNTTAESDLVGKCYVMTGMASQDETYDEDMIKFMFDIDDPAEYMSVYFEPDGTAYVYSLLYKKEVKKMKWIELDGVAYLEFDEDELELKKEDDGSLTTVKTEEDGDEFTITLSEVDKVPEVLKDYVK